MNGAVDLTDDRAGNYPPEPADAQTKCGMQVVGGAVDPISTWAAA
jgi:hypothetical protein